MQFSFPIYSSRVCPPSAITEDGFCISGNISTFFTFSVDLWLETSNLLMDSTSFPKKSILYGTLSEYENISTIPPRMANCPGSATKSTLSNPAEKSLSFNSSKSVSSPSTRQSKLSTTALRTTHSSLTASGYVTITISPPSGLNPFIALSVMLLWTLLEESFIVTIFEVEEELQGKYRT